MARLHSPGSSFAVIFRSSVLIGGSSLVTLAVGILRTKLLALWVGSAGIGLLGTLTSIATLGNCVGSLGINMSGVQAVAEASGDQTRISKLYAAVRWISLAAGIGLVLMFTVLREAISEFSFGTPIYATAVAIVAIGMFLSQVTVPYQVLLQGMRQIRALALSTIAGAICGTAVGLPLIAVWGSNGIAPMLVAVSAGALICSWWQVAKLKMDSVQIRLREMAHYLPPLIKLGVTFMLATLLAAATTYLIRIIVVKFHTIEEAGLYHAAYTLSFLYVSFVLNAMGSDYYPRLSSVSKDPVAMVRLANEQMEAALLMSLFAPLVLSILYSSEFVAAEQVLRWQAIGTLGRVVGWPLGFILMAQKRGKLFLFTELLTNIVHLALVVSLPTQFGFAGLGMAFAAQYLFYIPLISVAVRRTCGFRWSARNLLFSAASLCVAFGAFSALELSSQWGMLVGSLLSGISAICCGTLIMKRMGINSIRDLIGHLSSTRAR
jgi:enterobacterial common antigen flippase